MYFNIDKKKIFLLSWLIFWLSINSTAYSIIILLIDSKIINFINFIRSIGPIIILIIFLIFFFKKIFLFKKSYKDNLTYFYFFIFIFIQFIGFAYEKKDYSSLIEYETAFFLLKNYPLLKNFFLFYDQNYYLLNLFSLLIFFVLINIYLTERYLIYLFYISLIILILIYLPLGIFAYNDFLSSSDITAYWNHTTSPKNSIFSQPAPRVTGLSRSLLIIYIFLLCYFSFEKKKINNALLIIIILLLGTLIWSLQSRTIVYSFLFFNILILFFSKINNKKKLLFVILFILSPIILHNFVLFTKKYSLNILNKNYKDITDPIPLNYENFKMRNRITILDSGGRTTIWKNIINESKNSLIFGKGSQADRWYLDRLKSGNDNASSGFFYSLICGGLLGAAIYILIVYESLKLLIKSFLKIKINDKNNNIVFYSSFFILSFLLLRSLVENSFMLYSIDSFLFLSSFLILKKNTHNFLIKKSLINKSILLNSVKKLSFFRSLIK